MNKYCLHKKRTEPIAPFGQRSVLSTTPTTSQSIIKAQHLALTLQRGTISKIGDQQVTKSHLKNQQKTITSNNSLIHSLQPNFSSEPSTRQNHSYPTSPQAAAHVTVSPSSTTKQLSPQYDHTKTELSKPCSGVHALSVRLSGEPKKQTSNPHLSIADSQLLRHSFHESLDVPREKINKFITTVIDNLYHQKTKSQFAALILLTRKESRDVLTAKLIPCNDDMTNPNRSFMPEEQNFGNYIVARPEETLPGSREFIHAEAIIFEQLPTLLKAFIKLKKEKPALVFLYSWITPCEECTKLIIKYAGEIQPAKLIVAYTITCEWAESKETTEKNHKTLKKNNIDIHPVEYEHWI